MGEKLKVRDLLVYYVERYSLTTDGYSDVINSAQDGLGAYFAALKRILKETMINGVSVWDSMVQLTGPRRISIEDFERYCFKTWVQYIETNCDDYNKEALQADKARYAPEGGWWDDAAAVAVKSQNAALESGAYDYKSDTGSTDIGVSEDDIKRKGHNMMLEALYDIFYEEFRWDELRDDMLRSEILSGSEYNPEITPEMLEAQHRLKNYLNYIGKRKI